MTQQPPPTTSPALRQPRWSGKKTAVVAALAIGLSSAGAITASAAVPSGSTGRDSFGGRGGFGNFQPFDNGGVGNSQQQPGRNGQGAPNGNSGGTDGFPSPPSGG